ncbi:MAG: methionine--tRNA ligase [Saprospiraceae bacterium]|nr:methionine--tRNA ligase [Saprospiraceae bacterium]
MIHYKRHLVTAALPYANGPLHVGHLCGAYLPADVYVRFQRLLGKDMVFICGSDEHGAAITMRALKEKKTAQEIIDTYHSQFVETFKRIGISFNYYHRTSAKLHHETSQEFFLELYKKGAFEELESEQYYDPVAKQFLADRYITGTCPKCGNTNAYGDQCEQCGSSLNPMDLISPKSVLTGETPEIKKTKHWYLPLQQHESWLKSFIEEGTLDGAYHHDPDAWKNHVIGQCKSWLDGGLQSRAMTRDLDWGVDVPHEIAGSEGKKLYVWMDAPIGYISSTKQWAAENNKDWKEYWQDPETELIHFIGKDNIVFHCIIFPAILRSHGGFNLPANVPANQFMNLEGDKISTSRNWAVWVHEFLDELPGYEDSLRYYLVKNMPEQKDSEFTWKGFQDAHNNELVNNLSNFIHRVLSLTHKYYGGQVPDFDPDQSIEGVAGDELGGFHDAEMIYLFDKIQELTQFIREYDFRSALKELMEISTAGNQLLQNNEPWKLQKTDPDTVQVVMNLSLQYVVALSVILHPFMPFAASRLRKMMNLPELQEENELNILLDNLAEGGFLIESGHQINEAQYLFSKIEDESIQKQIDKLHQSKITSEPQATVEINTSYQPLKPHVSYDDFTKMDLRTAKIVHAEKVAKADKLLKLELDLGFEKRTVVSGIALHYKPEEIIGRQVLLLANLAPRPLKGIESNGMILMAENSEGKLTFVSADAFAATGSIVK